MSSSMTSDAVGNKTWPSAGASPPAAPPPRGGRVILKMSVQLPPTEGHPEGQKGTIHVFPGSDPKELAEAFCEKHKLTDPKLRRVVERHINDNIRALPSIKAAQEQAKGGGGVKTPPPPPLPPSSISSARQGSSLSDVPHATGVPLPPMPPQHSPRSPRDSWDAVLAVKNRNLAVSWRVRMRILRAACRGLLYLHTPCGAKREVLHRDIKVRRPSKPSANGSNPGCAQLRVHRLRVCCFQPANILLDEQHNAKLSDVGLATHKASPNNTCAPSTQIKVRASRLV